MEQGVPSAWPLLPAPALGTPRLTSTFLGHSPLSPFLTSPPTPISAGYLCLDPSLRTSPWAYPIASSLHCARSCH